MPLSHEQIEAVIQWMNTWEQLKDTAIPMRFKEDFLHKSDDERLCEKLRREKIGDELKLISDKMDKKSKQELLQNPLVKEIAQKYAQKVIDGSLAIPKSALWDDFVKSNEPVREWEILELDESFHLNGTNTPSLYFKAAVERGAIIKAVRRVSDGEIFVVGEYDAAGLKIFAFVIDNGKMCVQRYPDRSNGILDLSLIKKARTPLFTTTDLKPIYEGDRYRVLFDDGSSYSEVATKKPVNIHYKTFSNKDAENEYITLNKPCLSVSDVTKIAGQYPENYFKNTPHIVYQFTLDELITLAKSKQANS